MHYLLRPNIDKFASKQLKAWDVVKDYVNLWDYYFKKQDIIYLPKKDYKRILSSAALLFVTI